MNILFTCAGRRNYLVTYFRRALNGKGKLIAGDASPTAPALVEADIALTLPRVDDPDYIDSVCKIINEYDVGALLSLNDLELPILSRNKKMFKGLGCEVLVSDEEVINRCLDKLETVKFAKEIGIKTPLTYTLLEDALDAIEQELLHFPLVVKPRWGSASIGLEYPEDVTELNYAFQLLNYRLDRTILKGVSATDRKHAILIQNKIDGREYGIDVINDLKGNHKAVIVKRKLAMRAGETDKAITVDHPKLHELGRLVGENLGHVGNLDSDFFETESGELYMLEMNPRFGGGYPFSHEAGADVPGAILHWLNGEDASDEHFIVEIGLAFVKYDLLMKVECI